MGEDPGLRACEKIGVGGGGGAKVSKTNLWAGHRQGSNGDDVLICAFVSDASDEGILTD
jgi:hypothetical protein